MNCKICQDFLFEYADGTLNQELRSQIDRHLAACPDCTALLAGERNAMTRLVTLLEPALCQCHLSQGFQARLAETAAAAVSHQPWAQGGYSTWIRPMLAAAAIMLLLLGISLKPWGSNRSGNPSVTLLATNSVLETATNEFTRLMSIACISNRQDTWKTNQ